MATSTQTTKANHYRTSRIIANMTFDRAAIITLLWTLLGVALDGLAHFHNTSVESFFTPWHAVLYSGALAAALVHLGAVAFNRWNGYSIAESIPDGYQLSVVAACLFLIAGVGDMLWHTFFGIENTIEALLSPTHLLLFVSLLMLLSGPFRSLWKRYNKTSILNWKDGFPAVLSLAVTVAIITAFFSYLSPFASAWASNRYAVIPTVATPPEIIWPLHEFSVAIGISAFIFTGGMLVGLVLFVNRRFQLPFGSWTVIVTLSTLIVSSFVDEFRFVPLAIVIGLLLDIVIRRNFTAGRWMDRYYLYAFAMPTAVFTLYFVLLSVSGGIWWNVHVWAGAVALSGGAGLLAAYLMKAHYSQPKLPE